MMKVLLVDDDREEFEVTRFGLEKQGDEIEVEWARSAAKAHIMLAGGKFDCVVSDFQMPKVNGLEFLRELRAEGNDIPFIFLTGKGTEQIAAEALRIGADDYFTKQIDIAYFERLYNSLNRVIMAHGMRRLHESALKAMEESEETYRSLVERANDLVLIIVDSKVLFANSKVSEMLGYQVDEAVGMLLEELLHPAEREKTLTYYSQRVSNEGAPRLYESAMQHKNGNRVDVEINAGMVHYRDQWADLVFVRDISQRKTAERERDLHFKLSFNMFAVASFDGYFKQLNPAWERVVGWSTQEMLTIPWREFIHAEDLDKTLAMVEELKTGKQVRDFEMRFLCKDGLHCWLSWDFYPLREKELVFCVTRDVTERKAAAEKLARVEQEKLMILNSMTEHVIYLDRDLRVIWANAAAANTVDSTPEELVGKLCHQVWHRSEERCDNCPIISALRTGIAHSREMRSPNGSYWYIGGNPIKDADGNVLGVVETSLDITNRVLTENALRESEAKLRAVVTNVPMVLFSVDKDKKITFIEGRGLENTGVSPQDLVGAPALEALGGLPKVPELLEEAMAGNSSYKLITVNNRVYDVYALPDLGKSGRIEGVVGCAVNVTERMRMEDAIKAILAGTATTAGEDYLRSLVSHLASALRVRYAFVGEIAEDDAEMINTLAFWEGGEFGSNFSYQLAGTPCETVIGREPTVYPEGVRKMFKHDTLLAAKAVESYMGIPLYGPEGRVLGILVVMDDKPLEETPLAQSLMTIFAERTAMELKRRQDEKQLQEYQKRLRELASQLTLSEEVERRRIATGIHDKVGQNLSALKFELERMKRNLENEADRETAQRILDITEEIILDTRTLTFELSPPVLYELGLPAALEWLAENVESKYGIVTNVRISGGDHKLSEEISVLLFQVARELIHNTVKHSRARRAEMNLSIRHGDLEMAIIDNGKGFDYSCGNEGRVDTKGFGLFSIRERIGTIGGTLRVEASAGSGTSVAIEVPLSEEKD